VLLVSEPIRHLRRPWIASFVDGLVRHFFGFTACAQLPVYYAGDFHVSFVHRGDQPNVFRSSAFSVLTFRLCSRFPLLSGLMAPWSFIVVYLMATNFCALSVLGL